MAIYSGIQKKSFLKKLSRLVLSGLVSVGGVLATSDVAWADKTIPLEGNYPVTEDAGKHPVYPESDKTYATNVRFGYGNTSGESAARVYYLIGNGKDTVIVSKGSADGVLPNILNTSLASGSEAFKEYDVFNITYGDPGYSTRYIYGTRQVFDRATIIGISHDIPGRQNWLQDGYKDSQGNKVYFLPGNVSGGHVVIDGASVEDVYGGNTTGGAVNKDGIKTKDNITGEDDFILPKGAIVPNVVLGDTYVYCKNTDGTYTIISGYYQPGEPIPEPLENLDFFSANKNIVEIKNDAVIGTADSDVLKGGYATGDANYNLVYIENSKSTASNENCNAGDSTKKGSASNNTFIAVQSDINGVIGGKSTIGNASNNTVILVGKKVGTHTGCVYGGRVNTGQLVGAATGNKVCLVGSGGVFNDKVYYGSENLIGKTYENNTDEAPYIWDLYVGVSAVGKECSENTLAVYGTGTEIGRVHNEALQNIDFYIQKGLTYGNEKPMLYVSSTEDNTVPYHLNLTGKTFRVVLDGTPKANGDNHKIWLVKAANTIEGFDADTTQKKIEVNEGATITYDATNSKITQDEEKKNIYVELVGLSGEGRPYYTNENGRSPVNENGKSVVETRAAAAAIINGATDFMLDAGIGQARAAVNEAASEGNNELVPFVAMGGNNMRYETGSHVDMQGWNAAGGFAKQTGNFMYGVAFEYGKGGYDSYLDNGVHANGDIFSAGGVLFGNVKQADGVHYDAAFRVGRVKSDYNSDATSYDDGATYVGFSIGGGKEFKVNASDSVDVYGRYYYTHTNGSNVSLATHEQVDFDAVDSHRLRIGSRYTHEVDKKNQFYAGLAWQYEMGGDAKATINGYGAPVPSLKGHSGMLELGWKAQAAENVKLDLNLNGWVGKQRGIAGGVGVEFAF